MLWGPGPQLLQAMSRPFPLPHPFLHPQLVALLQWVVEGGRSQCQAWLVVSGWSSSEQLEGESHCASRTQSNVCPSVSAPLGWAGTETKCSLSPVSLPWSFLGLLKLA